MKGRRGWERGGAEEEEKEKEGCYQNWARRVMGFRSGGKGREGGSGGGRGRIRGS